MSASYVPRLVVIACLVAVASTLTTLWEFTSPSPVSFLHAQEAAGKPAPTFVGVDGCVQCHAPGTAVDPDSVKFTLLTESKKWQHEDKHSQAFALIDPAKSELSKQICDNLGIKDINEARDCLSCHANWQQKEGEWLARPDFH